MDPDLASLRDAVQRNCHVADARHARSHTLCTYLLKMREFFRWERGYPFDAPLPKDELGDWITEREALWEQLEDCGFQPIPLGGAAMDPFETAAINAELAGRGLVYSGGQGGFGTPHFFLAERIGADTRAGLPVLIAGREYARDLAAPPAMLLDGTLFVRRESMRRMLWERIEEWRWKRHLDAMARAMDYYAFDAGFERALESMTDNEVEAAVLHEAGEWQAEAHLGAEWHALLLAVSNTRGELVARAVRDHLADSLSTLPVLLERGNDASLHFYFANFKGMRRELNPELWAAYQQSLERNDWQPLRECVRAATERWLDRARSMLEICRDEPEQCAERIGLVLASFIAARMRWHRYHAVL